MDRLPDQLQPNLRIVFVGTAAGQMSADLGHYYAHPGNRFWRTIHETGITPRQYLPHEFPSLLDLRIGFTDMCKTGAGMDHTALNFPIDVPAFRKKMLQYRPKTIAFTSKSRWWSSSSYASTVLRKNSALSFDRCFGAACVVFFKKVSIYKKSEIPRVIGRKRSAPCRFVRPKR